MTSLTRWLANIDQLRHLEDLRRMLTSQERQVLNSEGFVTRWEQSLHATIDTARKYKDG